jgi:hypothetical protein
VREGAPDGRALDVADRARGVFTRLGARRPIEFPFDLAVKATIVVPLIVLGILSVRADLAVLAGMLLLPAAARTAWLTGAWVRRLRA